MDIELRDSYHQATTTFDPCEIVKCFKVAHRLGQSLEIADKIAINGISHILSTKPFPTNTQETIRLFSWLQAIRKDLASVVGEDTEFIFQAYLRYLKIPFNYDEQGNHIIFTVGNVDFHYTEPQYKNGDFQYNLSIRARDAVEFTGQNLSLENLVRVLAAYSGYAHLYLSETEWTQQLRDYGYFLDPLNRGEEYGGNYISFEFSINPKFKYIAQLRDNKLAFFNYIQNFQGYRLTHPIIEANTPYDVFRKFSFRMSMEQFIQEFRTLNKTKVPHISHQVEDQFIIVRHWYPYDSKFSYALKIENNFGECQKGYKISLFSDNSYNYSEFVVLQHPISVFRSPQEVLSYIQKRDVVTRVNRKHPLNLRQLFNLAKEIGAKHGITENGRPGSRIALIDDPKLHDNRHIIFAGFMLRPAWRRYRVKGKLGIKVVPTYIVEVGHTSGGGRESPPDYEIVRVGFADKPEDAVQLILDTIENERLQAESEAEFYDQEEQQDYSSD